MATTRYWLDVTCEVKQAHVVPARNHKHSSFTSPPPPLRAQYAAAVSELAGELGPSARVPA